MKLIPNFKQLLDNDKLPEEFSDWWEFDDTDALFQQEYKAYPEAIIKIFRNR